NSDDWYSFNVASPGTQIRLETRTPGDGAGQPDNNLNPHIDLFDPLGMSIAVGTTMSDGHNEYIQILSAPASGLYKGRITGEGSTTGDCFLGLSIGDQAPVVTNDVASQSDQYSDPTSPVTITAKDSIGDPLTAATSFTKDGGAVQAGLPANLALTPT